MRGQTRTLRRTGTETIAILLDARPPYLEGCHTTTSLLLAPLGTGTVLDALREALEAAEVLRLVSLPTFVPDGAYARALQATYRQLEVITNDGFPRWLERHELADRLVFIDVRFIPGDGWDFRKLLLGSSRVGHARHVVCTGHAPGGLLESVQYGEDLRVRALHRLYDGVTRLEVTDVLCSLLPVAVARALRPTDLRNLADVRTRLAATGVPGTDEPCDSDAVDLIEEQGLLAANERFLSPANGHRTHNGWRRAAADIWVGHGATVHPTSRLFGPIVIHPRATIGPAVVVAGPAVVGEGCQVQQGSVIAHSVVWPGTHLPPGQVAVRRVLVLPVGGKPRDQIAISQRTCSATVEGWPLRADANGNGHRGTHRLYPMLKRVLDLLITVPGLVVISPLLAVVAVLIKLTSRGPVLFGHEREGLGGRPFRCWKFRTMVHHAHHRQRELYACNLLDGPQFKLANDDRITPLGRVLRRTNIDELPQLFNVLRGEMSLIGPRPSPFRENQICVPWRQARLSVRPGITGLWQVCRRDRDAGDFHQWIYYDLLYVRHQSLWLDLRIFLATMLTLAGRWPVPLNWIIPAHKLTAPHPPSGAGWGPCRTAPDQAAPPRVSGVCAPRRIVFSVTTHAQTRREAFDDNTFREQSELPVSEGQP